MSIEITTMGSDRSINLLGNVPFRAKAVTRAALRDIANKIEEQAKIEAPQGETGRLKEHPVDVSESREGRPGTLLGPEESIETRAPSFGGGFSVRGLGGRFTRGGASAQPGILGTTFDEIDITVAIFPRHARWVHGGTGIYGPSRTPITPTRKKFLKFNIDGRTIFAKSVKGQPAQPFLSQAYVIINESYIPIRLQELDLQIRAIT